MELALSLVAASYLFTFYFIKYGLWIPQIREANRQCWREDGGPVRYGLLFLVSPVTAIGLVILLLFWFCHLGFNYLTRILKP